MGIEAVNQAFVQVKQPPPPGRGGVFKAFFKSLRTRFFVECLRVFLEHIFWDSKPLLGVGVGPPSGGYKSGHTESSKTAGAEQSSTTQRITCSFKDQVSQ